MLVLAAGLAGAAAITLGHLRLPAVLRAVAARLAPGFELEVGRARLRGLGGIDLERVRVRPHGGVGRLFAADRIVVRWAPADLVRRGRIDMIRVESPRLTLPRTLPPLPAASGDAAGDGWAVGRLVVRNGRVRTVVPGGSARVAFTFSLDLSQLGTDPRLAERLHRVPLEALRADVGGLPSAAAVDSALVTFSLAGLLERHTVDEVRLKRPTISPPDRLPASRVSPGEAGPSWRIARLVVHDGRFRSPPAGDTPGAAFAFAFDLRDLGLDPQLAERLHRIRVSDVRLTLGEHPPSLVVDSALVEFTPADLLARRLTRVEVGGGTLVLDQALRERVAAGGAAGGGGAWSLGVVTVDQMGIRVSDLGNGIPDVTLRVSSTLRDVPLDAEGLAKATRPQRIELADASLYSPVDPFRRVVHVGSVFVDFTLAELLHQEIGAVTVLSPTVYLGEDLIWYMNAARGQAATAPTPTAPTPTAWTVRRLRAELGRIMVTFNGSDRLSLPVTFRTQASNVALGDLATLRLAAQLRVPRQRYSVPGLDLELIDLYGDLRFGYPLDNVVNVLHVGTIRWRDYRLEEAWLSVTFDAKGINGGLGGRAYEGYANGGLSIPFGASATWTGWIAVDDLDLGRLSATVAAGRAELTGAATLQGSLQLRDGRIERADGRLVLDRPGRLTVPALDALLARLPQDSPGWQRDLARIGVETFRDYPYTGGEGTLTFAESRGEARLSLVGDQGARRLEAHYYEDAPLVARIERPAP
jgi:hypothetical protein